MAEYNQPTTQPQQKSTLNTGLGSASGVALRSVAAPEDPLPCPSSNYDIHPLISRFDYCRKQAHCVRENAERFIKDVGFSNVGFLTLTFPDNLSDHKRAYKRFKSFNANFLGKSEFFGNWICIKERQTRGAWHYHMLIDCKQDIRSSFSWERFDLGDYSCANAYLRQIWRVLRDMLPRYSFGRHELTPIRVDSKAISTYLAKYLFKSLLNRSPEDKGIKLYSTSGKTISSVPKFSWLTENTKKWRKNVKTLANFVLQSDQYEALEEHYGKRWAYHLHQSIIDLPKIMKEDIPF